MYMIISLKQRNYQLSILLPCQDYSMQIAMPGQKYDNEYHCDNVSKYVVKSFTFEQC